MASLPNRDVFGEPTDNQQGSFIAQQKTVWDYLVGLFGQDGTVDTACTTLGGVLTKTNIAASSTSTPADADLFPTIQSGTIKKLSWAGFKSALKSYFDTVYSPIGGVSIPAGVRQTVQYGRVSASTGLPDFVQIGTGLSVDIKATATNLVIHAAGGKISDDRIGILSADTTISGLAANSTNYLYADIASNGTVTLGSTTIAPVYQLGGAYSTSNGQFTCNINEATCKVGNGTTATQVWRTFFARAITGASTVTSVVITPINYPRIDLTKDKFFLTANGGTATILNSYNISSFVRNSAGNYTITFIEPQPNANYAITTAGSYNSGVSVNRFVAPTNPTTTTVVIKTQDYLGTSADNDLICIRGAGL